MKAIRSIGVILNNSWGNISLFGFLEVFHVWKPFFWIFRKKNFLVAQIYKCLFFFKIKIVLLKIFWNDTSCIFLNNQNNNKKIPKKFSVFGGTSLNTLKLFFDQMFYYFLSIYMNLVFSIISKKFGQHIVGIVKKGDF